MHQVGRTQKRASLDEGALLRHGHVAVVGCSGWLESPPLVSALQHESQCSRCPTATITHPLLSFVIACPYGQTGIHSASGLTCCDQRALRHHLPLCLTDQVLDLAAAEAVAREKLAPGRQRGVQQCWLLL